MRSDVEINLCELFEWPQTNPCHPRRSYPTRFPLSARQQSSTRKARSSLNTTYEEQRRKNHQYNSPPPPISISIMDTTTHPNPQPNPHHRKIDLQSPADLLYLQRNLSASATAKLNLHFPPKHAYATHIPLDGVNPNNISPSQPTEQTTVDPLRTRVEELVSTFLRETWSGAKHSISVNGLDANDIPDFFTPPPTSSSNPTSTSVNSPPPTIEIEGIDYTYTPYDPRLSTKLASLYSELESLTSTVSNLRRTNPRSGAENYLSALSNTLEADESVHHTKLQEAQQIPSQNLLNTQKIEADTPILYERGISELAGLSGLVSKTKTATAAEGEAGGRKRKQDNSSISLTETVGKVQRARRVVGELE